MKAIVLTEFNDKLEGVPRAKGEVFELTAERFDEITAFRGDLIHIYPDEGPAEEPDAPAEIQADGPADPDEGPAEEPKAKRTRKGPKAGGSK